MIHETCHHQSFAPGPYEELGQEIGCLVDEKQKMYGDSFHKATGILKILYPDGVQPDDYQNLLAVTRIIDKLFRVANGDQGGESGFKDICGYSLLAYREDARLVAAALNLLDEHGLDKTFDNVDDLFADLDRED